MTKSLSCRDNLSDIVHRKTVWYGVFGLDQAWLKDVQVKMDVDWPTSNQACQSLMLLL